MVICKMIGVNPELVIEAYPLINNTAPGQMAANFITSPGQEEFIAACKVVAIVTGQAAICLDCQDVELSSPNEH